MITPNGLFADVPAHQWNDWTWQAKNRIKNLADLKKYITLTAEEEQSIEKCLATFRMAVTPYYLSLIDLNDPEDPIRKQAIPSAEELYFAPEESEDSLNE